MKEVAKRIINITGIKIEIDKEKHSEIKININDKNQDKNKEWKIIKEIETNNISKGKEIKNIKDIKKSKDVKMIDKRYMINIVEINKNTSRAKDREKSIGKVKAKVDLFPKFDKKVSREIINKDKIEEKIIIRIKQNKNKRL